MLKNKIQLSRVGDLIGFIKQFMNQAASHPATGKVLPGVLTLEGFYRKRGGARELVTKERIIFRPGCLVWGKENCKCFNHANCLFFLVGEEMERVLVTDYLIDV